MLSGRTASADVRPAFLGLRTRDNTVDQNHTLRLSSMQGLGLLVQELRYQNNCCFRKTNGPAMPSAAA